MYRVFFMARQGSDTEYDTYTPSRLTPKMLVPIRPVLGLFSAYVKIGLVSLSMTHRC